MGEAEKTPNVVEVCNRKGLYDQLEDLQKRYYAPMHVHICTELLLIIVAWLFVRKPLQSIWKPNDSSFHASILCLLLIS